MLSRLIEDSEVGSYLGSSAIGDFIVPLSTHGGRFGPFFRRIVYFKG